MRMYEKMTDVDGYGDNDVDDVGNCNVMDEWNNDSDEGEWVDVHHLQGLDEDHPLRRCSPLCEDDLDRVDWPNSVPVDVDDVIAIVQVDIGKQGERIELWMVDPKNGKIPVDDEVLQVQ